MPYKKIGCVYDNTEVARQTFQKLQVKNPEIDSKVTLKNIKNFDCLLILGGDGFMLHNMHRFTNCDIPLYGINCGSVGFLLNSYNEDVLEKLEQAVPNRLRPLAVQATLENDRQIVAYAYNEMSILRKTTQAVHLKISINSTICFDPMIADGLIVATPAGSSSYNVSAGGMVIPIGANLLGITALNSFRPRRWRGALILADSIVECEILNCDKRPIRLAADFKEISNVKKITAQESKINHIDLLFDHNHSLEYRLFQEQFAF